MNPLNQNKEIAKNILEGFNKFAFEKYFQFALKETIYEDFPPFKDYPKTALPNHTQFYSPSLSHGAYEHIFLIQHYHEKIYNNSESINLITKDLSDSINYLRNRFPYPLGTTKNSPQVLLGSLFVISNLRSQISKPRINKSFGVLQKLMDSSFIDAHFEGLYNIKSFFENNGSESIDEHIVILKDFINNSFDGISLEISKNFIRVNPFHNQSPICSGIEKSLLNPLETVITTNSVNNYHIFKEFEEVINYGSENQLEEFIAAHYQLILGNHYDKIETQLWLKFPDLDIANKNRRLDIFARNTLNGDWDLFELKKNMPIVTKYRGNIPSFTNEVRHAIEQLRNYDRILQQDKVKKYFEDKGIQYYEPSLNLVIGRKPQITRQQWRTLLKNNSNNLNILTYDDFLSNVKQHFKIFNDFLK